MKPKEITIDILNLKVFRYQQIQAKQGDIGRKVVATITENGVPLDLTNRSVSFYAIKRDGKEIFNDTTIIDRTGGKAQFKLTQQALAVKGNLECELVVSDINGDWISTAVFYIEVVKSINSNEAIESENDFSLLQESLKKLTKLDNKADKIELEVQKNRIDTLTSLGEGSTTGDAELIDARVGADGVTYSNAGGAIRGQFERVKNDLDSQADVRFRNEIVNGDFRFEDKRGWSATDYFNDFEIINGVAKTTNFTNVNRGFIPYVNLIPGHKVFYKFDAKVDDVLKLSSFRVQNGLSGITGFKEFSVNNQWQTFSNVTNITTESDVARFFVIFSDIGDYPVYLDKVVYVDLTKSFGVGKEPTQEQMMAWLDSKGGYVEGDYVFSQREILELTNEKIINKVDKVEGMGLSEQNYTLVEKQKLEGIDVDNIKVETVNHLNEVESGKALDATQGKILNDRIANIEIPIVNNLTTEDANKALSAKQGKVLNDNMLNYNDDFSALETLATDAIDNNISGVLNNELVATDIANKLNAKEIEYAPRLTIAERNSDSSLEKSHLESLQSSRSASTLRPLVTFIDDDGYKGILTKLKPMFTSRNIPMGLALRGDADVIVDPIKRAEILDLQNNHGWEILSHTMAHMNIQNSTNEEVEHDFKTFIKTFHGYGMNVENIVYPGGQVSGKYPIIAKYFRAGFGTGMAVNDIYNIRDYNVYRMALGSSMIPEYDTLAKFKTLIDTAKANNQWIVFMTHCDYTNNDMQIIEDVLDYVIEQEIDIVTPNEGLRVFGSVVQSGLKTLGDYTVVKPNGIVDTNVYELTKRLPAKSENDAPESNQSPNKISKFEVRGWSIGDGIVTEYVHQQAWEYQEFMRTGTSPRVYVRKWKGFDWTPWSQYVLSLAPINYTMTARTIPANGTIDVTVVDTSILSWHTHTAQPSLTLEAGVMWQCWAHGNGALKIRLHNTNSTEVSLIERLWKISRIAINW